MPDKITVTIDNDEIEYNGRKFRPVEEEKKKWWRAEKDERYFYVLANGDEIDDHVDVNDRIDDSHYASHNYWRTIRDALLYGEFVKATVEGMANVNGAYAVNNGGAISQSFTACTAPQFDTVEQAQAYDDLRKRFAGMVRTYVE